MRSFQRFLLIPWLLFCSGALFAQQQALKIDQPGFQMALSAQTAGTTPGCPAGYYTLRVTDGGEIGAVPGPYSSELLLLSPGSLLLSGGINFGGLADGLVPAFAAVNVANAANENQQIRVALSGSRPRTALPVRVRVALLSRAPSPVATIYSEEVTLSPNTTLVRTQTVSPGFYVLAVTPLDAIPGADAYLLIGMETSFLDRAGGGIQGGVNFGGYHDPSSYPISGFAAFCLASAQNISVRTFGRTANPDFGAGDLRLQLVRDNNDAPSALLYDSQLKEPPSTVSGSLRISNALSTPLLNVSMNGISLGTVGALQTTDLPYTGPARGNVRIAIARGEGLSNSQSFYYTGEVLFTANGQTLPVQIRHNNLYREVAPNALSPVLLYSPQIDNASGSAIEARIFDGVENAEYSLAILGGLVTISNRNLGFSPPPRVYFPLLPGQTARVRAIASGGAVATVFSMSYSELAQRPSGDVVATVSASSFLGNSVCGTPTLVVPGCVNAATRFSQLLPVQSAGQVDVIQFSLCSDYNGSSPNTLRIIRPLLTCTLPSPAACPANSGLTLSSSTASGTPIFGPIAIQGNSSIAAPISGSQGVPGQSYCLSLRQTTPWEGAFNYEFVLSGTPPF